VAAAKLDSKGRVTIPVKIRHALGLKPGDRLYFVETNKRQFELVAVNRSVRELDGLFRTKDRTPVSIKEMNKVIAQRALRSK
jgi:antitoxin PrlF